MNESPRGDSGQGPASQQQVPHAQEPIVQRLRLQYSRLGRLRFVSHRDFQRALERAVRRARLPIAYSQGYSPHPKISYANAAPTGAESHAEYVEIGLSRRMDPTTVRLALDSALPDGLTIEAVVEAEPGKLADRLTGSIWEIRMPGVDPVHAAACVDRFLGLDTAVVTRMTKKGPRELDTRAAVVTISARSDGPGDAARQADRDGNSPPCAILRMVVRHGTPNVRPDDVLAALGEQAGLLVGPAPTMHRLAQGLLDAEQGTVEDPLAPQRDAT